MYVEVRVLRHEGKRLPSDTVRAVPPVRGFLSVDRWTLAPGGGEPSEIVTSALLTGSEDPRTPHVLPSLERVRIKRWIGSDLVLLGEEFVMGSGVPGRYWRQAWWVKLLGPSRP